MNNELIGQIEDGELSIIVQITESGTKGDKGDKGDPGNSGLSAYDSAVLGGYDDTIENFYSDLAIIKDLAIELESIL